jgi:hypothetical protein
MAGTQIRAWLLCLRVAMDLPRFITMVLPIAAVHLAAVMSLDTELGTISVCDDGGVGVRKCCVMREDVSKDSLLEALKTITALSNDG